VLRELPWTNVTVAIPAFLTMVTMPFTYSITNGIGAGFVSYTVLRLLGGGPRDVGWLMIVSSAAFVVYFAIAPLSRLFM